jgi:uncharacterized protein
MMAKGHFRVLLGAGLFLAHGAEAQNLSAVDVLDIGRAIVESASPTRQPAPQPSRQKPTNSTPAPSHDHTLVRGVQAGLARLGYAPGPADGLIGRNTRTAIRQFERDGGLPETGQPSADLLARIDAQAGTPATSKAATPQPSFNCAKASTDVEHAICNSVALADQDRRIAALYSSAIASASDPGSIRTRQRLWIGERDSCGGTEACLSQAMAERIGELTGEPGVAPPSASSTVTVAQDAATGAAPNSASPITQRADGLRVDPEGRIIFPASVMGKTSPEYPQILALIRLLRHAAASQYLDEMVKPDDLGRMAEFARDYLPLEDLRPYFCTADEMEANASDCENASDVVWDFTAKGGEIQDSVFDRLRPNPFIWWRGGTEFARRRSVDGFLQKGLLEKIAQTAPETPVRLHMVVDAALDTYDFDKGEFPVFAPNSVGIPGSKSTIDISGQVHALAVPPGAAEDLLRTLKVAGDGQATVRLGIDVDLSPTGWTGVPVWDAKLVSAGYYLDKDATRPLEFDVKAAEQARSINAGDRPTVAAAPASQVLRDFDLQKEDGRILLSDASIDYVMSSAARDLVDILRDDTYPRSPLPLIFRMLNSETRTTFFGCDTFDACGTSGFRGETEFEQKRLRTAFMDAVPSQLIARAPTLPIPMRQYLDMSVGEYDFDKNGFPIQILSYKLWHVMGLGLEFKLQPLYKSLPTFIEVAPDQAERMLTDSSGNLTARIDFDVLNMRVPRTWSGELLSVFRLASLAIVDDQNRGAVYYKASNPAAAPVPADIAARFIGPVPDLPVSPDNRPGYPVLGVTVGMGRQATIDALGATFDGTEITADDTLVRAERGLCRYDRDGLSADEEGALCFAAALKDGAVARIVLREAVSTGSVSDYIDRQTEAFGEPAARWDGANPKGAEGREFFGWGDILTLDRNQLGRIAFDNLPREAELEALYVTPQRSVVTLRVDPAGTVRQNQLELGKAVP